MGEQQAVRVAGPSRALLLVATTALVGLTSAATAALVLTGTAAVAPRAGVPAPSVAWGPAEPPTVVLPPAALGTVVPAPRPVAATTSDDPSRATAPPGVGRALGRPGAGLVPEVSALLPVVTVPGIAGVLRPAAALRPAAGPRTPVTAVGAPQVGPALPTVVQPEVEDRIAAPRSALRDGDDAEDGNEVPVAELSAPLSEHTGSAAAQQEADERQELTERDGAAEEKTARQAAKHGAEQVAKKAAQQAKADKKAAQKKAAQKKAAQKKAAQKKAAQKKAAQKKAAQKKAADKAVRDRRDDDDDRGDD